MTIQQNINLLTLKIELQNEMLKNSVIDRSRFECMKTISAYESRIIELNNL